MKIIIYSYSWLSTLHKTESLKEITMNVRKRFTIWEVIFEHSFLKIVLGKNGLWISAGITTKYSLNECRTFTEAKRQILPLQIYPNY